MTGVAAKEQQRRIRPALPSRDLRERQGQEPAHGRVVRLCVPRTLEGVDSGGKVGGARRQAGDGSVELALLQFS